MTLSQKDCNWAILFGGITGSVQFISEVILKYFFHVEVKTKWERRQKKKKVLKTLLPPFIQPSKTRINPKQLSI